MQLDTITIPKDVARRKLDAARHELKRKHNDEVAAIVRAMDYALKGRPVIQLSQVIEAGGYFPSTLPRIAICRSDYARVECQRALRGMTFSWGPRRWSRAVGDIRIATSASGGWIRATTIVPIVPSEVLRAAGLRGRGALRRFYTLFEVEEWVPVPPRDPALLEHIGGDLYAVRAVWDLTELERAIIAGTR